MVNTLLGGPCDGPALEVGSRLTGCLQTTYGDACTVRVAWDGEPWAWYSYRVVAPAWRAVQYITGHWLADVVSYGAVAEMLAERITENRGRPV